MCLLRLRQKTHVQTFRAPLCAKIYSLQISRDANSNEKNFRVNTISIFCADDLRAFPERKRGADNVNMVALHGHQRDSHR
jgi:hypothetical protein